VGSCGLAAVTITLLAVGPLAHAESPSWPHEQRTAGAQSVIGWAERVRLPELGVEEEARLDTGASLTSSDATILRVVRGDRSSQPLRVVFAIDCGKGGAVALEREIVDWVRIKNKGARGSTRRPVVTRQIRSSRCRLTGATGEGENFRSCGDNRRPGGRCAPTAGWSRRRYRGTST
jgi:hypothetical protein